jgi:hypothetical protein
MAHHTTSPKGEKMATRKKAPGFGSFELFGGRTDPFCSSKFVAFMEKQSFYLSMDSGHPMTFISDNGAYRVDIYHDGTPGPAKWELVDTDQTIAEGRGAQDLAQWLLDHPNME